MTHELAFYDWLNGMKYKDIAAKYGVSENTVKSWYKRHHWKEKKSEDAEKSVQVEIVDAPPSVELVPSHKRLRLIIEKDLKEQLHEKGAIHSYYIDLVDDYMALWDVKNMLIDDINERGVTVPGMHGQKKNDSVGELNKTNAQMLRILAELGLKVTDIEKPEPDDDDEL
ncbi:P27 family phage terminase small subunit [Lysinibacillus capsici]|uniref:P27 family phage terminase small subunit n=2 Tax=Lysinibacillus capsici TaxID=2115968 RepID=UPI0030819528|nr:P27 family phage terminase small subunit [Lysinibacillus capsici]